MGGAKDAGAVLVEQGFRGWGPVMNHVAVPGPLLHTLDIFADPVFS